MGYSKNKLKKKNFLKVMFVVLLLLLIAGITILVLANTEDMLTIGSISDKSNNVSDDIAKNSKPIIIDNIIVGAVYNHEFVSANKYLSYSSNKVNTEMNVYTSRGKNGTFKINSITKNNTYTQALTSSINVTEEYFAIPSSDVNAMPIVPIQVDATDEDYKAVKDALGKYRLLNNSINISSVYDVSVNLNDTYKIMCVTSSKNDKGIYSAVIFTNSNRTKSKIIKYSYVKDKENASSWPIYSFEFAADLNGDGNSEIMIREINESEVKYDILEYDNNSNNFVEVLSAIVQLEEND
ncbi:MAG: hypothetical protein Q4D02_08555 [Clostridia bacterium]|nr:hypothetical protein [Clostridia bacterium]